MSLPLVQLAANNQTVFGVCIETKKEEGQDQSVSVAIQAIQEIGSQLSDGVNIQLEAKTITCSKTQLTASSAVFEKMLSSGMREEKANTIDFSTQIKKKSLSETSVSIFFEWMAGKKPTPINEECILEILDLAHQYDVVELKEQCTQQLIDRREFFTLASVSEIYHFAKRRAITRLQSFYFATLYHSHEEIEKGLLKDHLQELTAKGVRIDDGDLTAFPRFKVSLDDGRDLTLYQELQSYCPVHSFEFPDFKCLTEQHFRALISLVKEFKSLSSLRVINIKDRQLKELLEELPALTSLEIDSVFLTEINAPYLKILLYPAGDNETALEKIFIPQAKWVDCSNHRKLKKIISEGGLSLDCHGCGVLNTLDVPNAISFNGDNCFQLVAINVPKAKFVDCFLCERLQELNAQNAQEINVNGCVKLTEIIADQVDAITLRHCPWLIELHFANARSVILNTCLRVTRLHAPKAQTVECFNCPELEQISAEEATMVKHNSCDKLKMVNAPKIRKH